MAFQPNKGGYSIFGNCLDGSDQGVRLEQYMEEELGGQDGLVVEDCFLVGYLLVSGTELDISPSELFYTHDDAAEQMLFHLAQIGELDLEKVKVIYASDNPLEDDWYGIKPDAAWLAGQCVNRHWNIQRVYIYDLLHMVFPDPGGHIDCTDDSKLIEF